MMMTRALFGFWGRGDATRVATVDVSRDDAVR